MTTPSLLRHLSRVPSYKKLLHRSLAVRPSSLPTRSLASKNTEQIERFLNVRHLRLQNGEKAPLLFSPQEYERRLVNLRKLMKEKNIGAAVFTSIHNIAYYSNYVYCSMGRPYALVVTQDSQTSVSALVDGGQPWRRTYGENIVYTDWKKDNYIAAIKEVVGDMKDNIGVEMDHMNLLTHKKLSAAIPTASIIDISQECGEQRMIKSDEEIEITKIGAAAADIGGEVCKASIKEGVEEWEIGREVVNAMTAYMAKALDDRAEIMDAWAWIQSGSINSDGCHNPMTRRKIKKGDIIMLNCFPESMQGYYNALERVFFYDHVDDASLKYWEANCAVHRRGLELIKPGIKCSEIAQELNEMLMEMGMLEFRTFGYGHSFGIISHYYGREPGLELREDVHTVIQPGMVLSMEPMLWIPEGQPGAGGYREHDCLVVHHDGQVENVTKFPFGPEHNIVK